MYINLALTPLYGDNLSYYKFIFIIALITLAIIIMLKSSSHFIIQAVLLFGLVTIGGMEQTVFAIFFTIIQIGFSLWVIYKIKLAIDYNYRLVLEKTHLTARKITENDYTGTRKSF